MLLLILTFFFFNTVYEQSEAIWSRPAVEERLVLTLITKHLKLRRAERQQLFLLCGDLYLSVV